MWYNWWPKLRGVYVNSTIRNMKKCKKKLNISSLSWFDFMNETNDKSTLFTLTIWTHAQILRNLLYLNAPLSTIDVEVWIQKCLGIKGHFTHEPRAVTIKLWEPKRKCPKAVPPLLQHHVVWSQIFKCSVKSYVTRPSTKCYFKEFLFMQVLTHDKNRINQELWAFGVPWSPGFVLGLPPRGDFWK